MNPALAQWLPVVVMLIAIWLGLLYNNKRLDDFRSSANRQLDDFKDLLKSEVARSESNVLRAIAELRAEVMKLEARVTALERPTISRP